MRCALLVLAMLIVTNAGPVHGEEIVAEETVRPIVSLVDRSRGLLGIAAILTVAVALSENRRAISIRVVGCGLLLQVALAIFLLKVSYGRHALAVAEQVVETVLGVRRGWSEIRLRQGTGRDDGSHRVRVRVPGLTHDHLRRRPVCGLYHLHVMPIVVKSFAWVMVRLLGTSGAESLNVAASLFLGQTEAPLTIRPFLPGLTRSELLVVMVSGMALVAGGVLGAYIETGASASVLLTAIAMSAPASIYIAKIMVPEVNTPETLGTLHTGANLHPDSNVLEAAARGTREGLSLALNVAAILISFLALIALLNRGIALAGGAFGVDGMSLQMILGVVLSPVAWLLGIPWEDCRTVGGLLGSRAITNEMIAYASLGSLREALQPRSVSITTIALCGFANLSSIGIQIGGIGALVPERQADLAQLGFRAFLAATLANLTSACIAGMFL